DGIGPGGACLHRGHAQAQGCGGTWLAESVLQPAATGAAAQLAAVGDEADHEAPTRALKRFRRRGSLPGYDLFPWHDRVPCRRLPAWFPAYHPDARAQCRWILLRKAIPSPALH